MARWSAPSSTSGPACRSRSLGRSGASQRRPRRRSPAAPPSRRASGFASPRSAAMLQSLPWAACQTHQAIELCPGRVARHCSGVGTVKTRWALPPGVRLHVVNEEGGSRNHRRLRVFCCRLGPPSQCLASIRVSSPRRKSWMVAMNPLGLSSQMTRPAAGTSVSRPYRASPARPAPGGLAPAPTAALAGTIAGAAASTQRDA